jgi:hypothetical protein
MLVDKSGQCIVACIDNNIDHRMVPVGRHFDRVMDDMDFFVLFLLKY